MLAPGEQLPPERELAERMQISRSTLRQALGQLTGSGYLVAVRGRAGGTFVSDSPPIALPNDTRVPPEMRELIDFRAIVEVGAAMLAVSTATDQLLTALQTTVDQQRLLEPDDAVGYMRADAAFHLALARAAGNQRHERMMADVQSETLDLLVRRIRAFGLPPSLIALSTADHQAIVDALVARDANTASEAVRRHMRLLEEALAGPEPVPE